MNLNQMKYFKAVCELGTVSAAAELLHISQPSLSVAIKELENEFGITLFNRAHRGMQPTAEGELLLNMSKDIIDRVEYTEKVMHNLGNNKKSLALGIPPMICSLLLPTIYNEFLVQNQDINLEITECGHDEMIKKILDDQLDLAFISHGTSTESGIEDMHIDSLEIVCCSAAHSCSMPENTAVTPHALSDVPVVVAKDGFFQTYTIKNWFSSGETVPNVLMTTDQLSTMVKIISNDTATGFLFKRLIENDNNFSWRHLDPPINVNVSLIWKKNSFFSAGMKSLKEFFKNRKL